MQGSWWSERGWREGEGRAGDGSHTLTRKMVERCMIQDPSFKFKTLLLHLLPIHQHASLCLVRLWFIPKQQRGHACMSGGEFLCVRDSSTVHQSALSGLKRLKSCLSTEVRILKSISLPFSLHLQWIGFFFPPLSSTAAEL